LGPVHLYSADAGDDKDFKALLTRPDIKAVIIALPIPAQPSYIAEALLAGKHVLAEKPIAPTVSQAKSLVAQYNKIRSGESGVSRSVTWCVAENFRYLDSFAYGADMVKSMGKVLGFRTNVGIMVKPGGKYFETAWRKQPEYQGGFLLDGGVHFIAGTRLLMGQDHAAERVSAFTAQLQEHLPPIDTVNAIWQMKGGISGSFTTSFGGGTTLGHDYTIICEKGAVSHSGFPRTVTVTIDGQVRTKEFPDEGQGVKQEVAAWAKGLQSGNTDPKQGIEEALKDLEIVSAHILAPGAY
jgi:predicted dehydrogenase